MQLFWRCGCSARNCAQKCEKGNSFTTLAHCLGFYFTVKKIPRRGFGEHSRSEKGEGIVGCQMSCFSIHFTRCRSTSSWAKKHIGDTLDLPTSILWNSSSCASLHPGHTIRFQWGSWVTCEKNSSKFFLNAIDSKLLRSYCLFGHICSKSSPLWRCCNLLHWTCRRVECCQKHERELWSSTEKEANKLNGKIELSWEEAKLLRVQSKPSERFCKVVIDYTRKVVKSRSIVEGDHFTHFRTYIFTDLGSRDC